MEAFTESSRPRKRPKYTHSDVPAQQPFAAPNHQHHRVDPPTASLLQSLSLPDGVADAVANGIHTDVTMLPTTDNITTWRTHAPSNSSWQWQEMTTTQLSEQPSAATLSFSSDDSVPDMRVPSPTSFEPLPHNNDNFHEFVPITQQPQPSPALTKPLTPIDNYYHRRPEPPSQSSYPLQQGQLHQHSSTSPRSTSRGSSPETDITLHQQSLFASPFAYYKGILVHIGRQRYARPYDGQVNGYVKFKWPATNTQPLGSQMQVSGRITGELPDDHVDATDTALEISHTYQKPPFGPLPPGAMEYSGGFSPPSTNTYLFSPNHDLSPTPGTNPNLSPKYGTLSPPSHNIQKNKPLLSPPGFGLEAVMDSMDRKLWDFYIKNWCPGRSILQKTNLWQQDFAQMQRSPGVLAAIQSLAGIYICDYLPAPGVVNRVNQRFAAANARLKELLRDQSDIAVGRGSEVITILVILSMQDIVLTENRLQKPKIPRWLRGFQQSEYFLGISDTGSRFWNSVNIQQDSLVVSQAIIVGRAVILAQPMMPLTDPASFDPETEVKRFGWLLYGTRKELYEIHGGCGFAKKLMHVMSQITYCAARLQQDPQSPIIPMTASYLMKELQTMRQWSSESMDWETAKTNPQTIERVEAWPPGSIVDKKADMTDVTAEAWRFAAIIYLQCRVLRLPRNDPSVIENLQHLANCVRVMPTSGMIFTAQAPLFPVFLLGMLATLPGHKQTSQDWFNQVVMTPVRSSVPPLYQVLRRIWVWIDNEIELPAPGTLSAEIGNRRPWWEVLVSQVEKREEETLCLT